MLELMNNNKIRRIKILRFQEFMKQNWGVTTADSTASDISNDKIKLLILLRAS